MRLGLFASGPGLGPTGRWPDMVARFSSAERAGYSSAWSAQLFGPDPLLLSCAALTTTEHIEIGTAVVTMRTRHPVVLAQEALTLAAASGGRFTLGLGLGHRPVLERNFGLSAERPLRHLTEYLEIVHALMRGERVQVAGEEYTVDAGLKFPDAAPPSLLLAALGPQVLKAAGRLSDGTVTWMGGVKYLETVAVPLISEAAASAGRRPPRIVAGFPIAVTNRPDSAYEQAAQELRLYGRMPSYKAVLDIEGAAGPTDVCIVGDEGEVERYVGRIAEAGVTDLIVAPLSVPEDPGSQQRTVEFLAGLGVRTS